MNELIPAAGLDSKGFWEACARRELRIQQCTQCQTFRFPPRDICPSCLSSSAAWALVSGRGTIWSFAVVRHPFHAAFKDKVPYVIAIVELEARVRMATNIVDCRPEEIKIGMPVSVVFEERAPGVLLPVFRLSSLAPMVELAQAG